MDLKINFDEHQAKRENVSLRANIPSSNNMLWAQVSDRTTWSMGVILMINVAEVHKLETAGVILLPLHHDILGLQVAVV